MERLREVLKYPELKLQEGDEVIIWVHRKTGSGPAQIMKVGEIPYEYLMRDVMKVQLHKGGPRMSYNGVMFIVR